MSKRFPPSRLRGSLRWAAYIAVLAVLGAPLLAKLLLDTTPRLPADPVPAALEGVLTAVFDPDLCTTGAMAAQDLRGRLDRSALSDWRIDSTGVRSDECVTWALSQSNPERRRTITLISALSPEVRTALEEVRDETYVRCLAKEQAIDLVTSTLAELGETGFEVRTDGPFQVPLDREREVKEHFEAGCWMYSTVAWFDGRPVFFVSGK